LDKEKNLKAKEEFAYHIASLAQRAILYEVSTTPKPGLVDRFNSGSHNDMDFFTFMASTSVLYKGLYECTLEGLRFEDKDITKLIDKVRKPGIQCEKEMFNVTKGVNTHKGIIFSMGIVCAVVGNLHRKSGNVRFAAEEICNEVKDAAKGLVEKDFKGIGGKKTLTHGEKLYKEYGLKGIRGEVESGFASIRKNTVEIIRKWKVDGQLPINDLFLEILFNIMSESEDTNVIVRGGFESLEYVRSVSKNFLQTGGMLQPGANEKLDMLNNEFVKRNISPGGSADLLAVAIFLGMIEDLIM
jgi:triphosphoribosyl-dephospho-CoA synthase